MIGEIKDLWRASVPQVWVREVESVEGTARTSSLRAVFTIEIEGVGRIAKCRCLEARKGAFVTGPSYRDSYAPGGWAQPVNFEPELADTLLATVQERLAQDAAS